ncbi:MAG: hypothetical protein JEY99_12210 [Spirochaetales bacterium]|nr:hypothetical protein [Spirochaetales bacterium]
MARMTIRVLWVALTLCGLAFLFFLTLSFNQFSSQMFEISYRGRWAFDNSIIKLIKYFPALMGSAILICYSLFYKPALNDSEGETLPFYRLVMYSLILFLISTLAGFLLNEVIDPGAEARQYRRMEETIISREIRQLAEEAEKNGDPRTALEFYKRLSTLQPEETESLEIKQESLEQQLARTGAGGESTETFMRMVDKSPQELLNEARGYEIEEDYFSAYYYSSLAYQIDNQYPDARQFAARMWSKIESTAPMREELERSYIFNKKKEGTAHLSAGRGMDAYYLFLTLREYLSENEIAPDPDINKYLETARQLCLESSYFTEDTYTALTSPGYRNLVFRNRDTVNGREHTEIVSFGRAISHIPSRGMWMVKDVQVIRYNQTGIQYKFTAPFGKIIFGSADGSRGRLIMHGINPRDKEANFHVTYLEGSSRLELENILPLYIGSRELEALAEESLDYTMTNLLWLWEGRGVLDEAGFPSGKIHLKILEKILYPFSFIILCLISVTFGWRMRQRSGGPIPATFLLFPFLPSLVFSLFELYTAANVSLLSFIRDLGGFIPAFTILLVIQAIILTFSFILMAGQRS